MASSSGETEGRYDNFHYGDEDERFEYGTFPTAKEALETCRRLVDEALVAEYRDGETAKQLFDRYKSFGDDPFVVAPDGVREIEFSAWTYAKQRASELASPGQEGAQNRQSVLDRKSAVRRL